MMDHRTLRGHARYLWGGKWCVALARRLKCSTDLMYDLEAGRLPVPDFVVEEVAEGMRERIEGLQNRLESMGA